MMGIEETIARDEDDYIKIAVRLGTDHRWRRLIILNTEARKASIFNDEAPIRALEDFLERVCGEGMQS